MNWFTHILFVLFRNDVSVITSRLDKIISDLYELADEARLESDYQEAIATKAMKNKALADTIAKKADAAAEKVESLINE